MASDYDSKYCYIFLDFTSLTTKYHKFLNNSNCSNSYNSVLIPAPLRMMDQLWLHLTVAIKCKFSMPWTCYNKQQFF